MIARSTRTSTLAQALLERAHAAGFELAAVGPVAPPATGEQFVRWLAMGYAGEMNFLARPAAVTMRLEPQRLLPGARSVLVVGTNYHSGSAPGEWPADPSRGRIARYAQCPDYHGWLAARLRQVVESLRSDVEPPLSWRIAVDTSPVLERDAARRVGLGFVGKNTNLVHPRLGSWLFLGEVFLDADLPSMSSLCLNGTVYLQSGHAERCGSCTRCLDACPTEALVAPYTLDARRCISYLTIELRSAIPRPLREKLGNHIFGCDVCQEVCPWNGRFARATSDATLTSNQAWRAPPLLELLALDEAGFRERTLSGPVQRARRRGLVRNAAVAAGNWGAPEAVPALAHLLHDPEPLIRGHAAWALGRIATEPALRQIRSLLRSEADEWVREELRLALG